MIRNDQELQVTLRRIERFREIVAHLRRIETNPVNYHLSASGFLAEIDRMQLEVREHLALHPAEMEPEMGLAIPSVALHPVGAEG